MCDRNESAAQKRRAEFFPKAEIFTDHHQLLARAGRGGGIAAGGALPASVPLAESAQRLPDDAPRLPAMARGVEEVSRTESGRNSPQSRLRGGNRGAGAGAEFEEEFSYPSRISITVNC